MIEDFELLETIAQSSRSTLFRARDRRNGDIVAIKLLPESSVGTAWKREVAALTQIQHQNVIKLIQSGRCSDGAYLALEWMPGVDLGSLISRGPLNLAAFTQLARQTLSALSAMHQADYLHRDVKPENLMQTQSGSWKLIDFGESRPLIEAGQQAMIGSIYFMAPEQFGQAPLTPRTDLYSLGCTFYQALTGRYLHDGDTTPQVIASHLHPRPNLLQEHSTKLPRDLLDWLQSLVTRQSSGRPISAAKALEQFESLNIDSRS